MAHVGGRDEKKLYLDKIAKNLQRMETYLFPKHNKGSKDLAKWFLQLINAFGKAVTPSLLIKNLIVDIKVICSLGSTPPYTKLLINQLWRLMSYVLKPRTILSTQEYLSAFI